MIEHLPQSLRDIADAIGVEKTLKLVNYYGGKRIWIPRQPPRNWVLFDVLGYEAACKLVSLCSSSQVEIPNCQSLRLAARNRQIRADRANSMLTDALSSKYGISRRQIREICNTKAAL